jgi:NAD(P)-dependent dehydrogenase (short-subunit alcohol dehydrogenase family)
MNILVTGGASGLGEAITKRLVSDPSNNVFFSYHKSVDNARDLEATFSNAKGIQCDFSSPQNVEMLAGKIQELNIEVLVNNAMTGFEKNHFHKLKPEYFLESFQKNIIPTIRITQAALTHFRKNKFGKIITVLSAAIINRHPIGWSEYAAGKSYLLSLSKSWAIENASFNISSNSISPGFMQTSLTSDTDERMIADMIAKHPLKNLLKVEEAADAVSFFVTASQQINGTNLIINAGQNVI